MSWHELEAGGYPTTRTSPTTVRVEYPLMPKYADASAYAEARYAAASTLGVKYTKLIVVDVALNKDEEYVRVESIEFGVKK